MQKRRLIDQTPTIVSLQRIIEIKIQSSASKINDGDKIKIKDSIMKVQYSYPALLKYGLHFINENTAAVLAQSSHVTLKEWGEKCVDFYTKRYDLHGYIHKPSGLVMSCDNLAFFRIETNNWQSIYEPATYVKRCGHGYDYTVSGWGPPSFMPLVSPVHIAAMLGDIALIQDLNTKGMRLDENINQWNITPLEMAVSLEQLEMVDFLLKNNATKNLYKIFKLAVEKGSLKMIDKFMSHNIPLSDEIIEAARFRDKDLGLYLETKIGSELSKLADINPLNALKHIINSPKPPLSLVVDLILDHPKVITKVENEATGDTILHWTITNKDLNSIQALMEAIYEAKLRAPGLRACHKIT
jgi:hypothetical protein